MIGVWVCGDSVLLGVCASVVSSINGSVIIELGGGVWGSSIWVFSKVPFSAALPMSRLLTIDADAGLNALRKRRFLLVILPDPSTLTRYWSCSHTSTTEPVLYHLFGSLPVWFCKKHLSPSLRGEGVRRVYSEFRLFL